MSAGRLIAVVGPSGAGKDSVMAGLKAALPGLRLVRRTITRARDLGGEDHDAVTPEAFRAAARAGMFCVHWSAHGLNYGIPADVLTDTRRGIDCLANFSRGALGQAQTVFPNMIVLNITASPETLARRLAGRGRESVAEITARLARAGSPLPEGLQVVSITNDGALADTVCRALNALQPARA
ncbi:phosphonate metabolism protein/1,5-bisphosphokinase (PRPP-forming) PhnN [Actibacterium sp. XHP0104]|uniref:phosphonate metabolism protein/1,5-bisphosphokinase (PRPP-forming) PhnN n=1 Tax=Actibacterium sp. XHP0104 TaxID=2984335 RepID=UPI0021E8A890|nr:phosphonate metabolism protein/1,5-bisphosphokinase (PRPP-forming) PhnN [Actibacterium sp. XHP0104]MCV2881505.1 phosphonate metabolism protein/1,5-bisphosphokinase (PRPP-forming) PhnN [Actibacterium sp. XHP0104]